MTQRNLIAANRARMLMVISFLALVSTSIAKPAVLTSIVRHDSTVSTYSFFGQCGAASGLDVEPDAVELMMLQQENATNASLGPKAEPYPKPGLDPVVPFLKVMKDGYRKVKCMKDWMYYFSDKFGENRNQYENGAKASVSIVVYDTIIKKMSKRKPMSTKVCFDFCRTVPDMQYFGLVNGHSCYCTPYYQEMAGDRRFPKCDSKCPGDIKDICGGMEKSSLYSMHKCDHMAADIAALRTQATNYAKSTLDIKIAKAKGLAKELKATASSLYSKFGLVADTAAMKHMENAQKFADEIKRKVDGAQKLSETMAWQVLETGKVKDFVQKTTDFSNASILSQAENWMEETQKQLDSGATFSTELDALIALAENEKDVAGSATQYKSVMHFVHKNGNGIKLNGKKFEALPSVCSGDTVKKTVLANSTDSCASACDAADLGRGHTCVGFQYFQDPKMGSSNICLLISKFKTATYYTACGINTTAAKPASFLELRRESEESYLNAESESSAAPFEVTCYGKFLKFTKKLALPPTGHGVNFCYK